MLRNNNNIPGVFMQKKRVFMLGCCVADDVVYKFTPLLNEFGYETVLTNYQNGNRITARLSSLFDKPGPIAKRLYDECHKAFKHMMDSRTPEQRLPEHSLTWLQYDAVLKFNTPETLYADVNSDDIIIIDLHGCTYTGYDDGLDSFWIHPAWPSIQDNFPKWFKDKVNSFTGYNRRDIRVRKQKLITVLSEVNKKFKHVIVIGNVFTDKARVNDRIEF